MIINRIELQPSSVESDSSVGIKKIYYSPLKRIYSTPRNTHPNVGKQVPLKLAVKKYDCFGPENLVPLL